MAPKVPPLPTLTRRSLAQVGVGALLCACTSNLVPGHLPQTARETSFSRFDKSSTAEEVTLGLDLSGKTILVTGSNSGIGFETMRVLVLRGAHVLAFARSMEKAQGACELAMLHAAYGKATPFACDQADYGQVVSATDAVHAMDIPIDAVICNAGLNAPTLEQVNGIEKHFAVQHLSHFILVNRTIDLVKAAPQGRIVVVASILYKDTPRGGIDFDNLSGDRAPYNWRKMYGQSKLANGLFARELAHRLEGTGVTSNVLHPGLISGTNIMKVWEGYQGEDSPLQPHTHFRWLQRYRSEKRYGSFIKNVTQGAATQCYVATHPTLAHVNGAYFEDCRVTIPTGYMQDDALSAKLWAVSEKLTRPYLVSG